MDSAWLALGALAHNLARWSARLGQLTEGTCPIALATLRRRFISVPGQLSRSARRTTLHLARNWRWAEAFLVALRALRAVAPRLASSLAPSPTERTEGASDCRAPVRFHPVPKRPSNRENHPEPPLVARSLQPVPEAVRPLSGASAGSPAPNLRIQAKDQFPVVEREVPPIEEVGPGGEGHRVRGLLFKRRP